jgi:PAS domain-containing protein
MEEKITEKLQPLKDYNKRPGGVSGGPQEGPESRHVAAESLEDQDEWSKYKFIANTAKEFMTLINRDYIYEFANESYCRAHKKTGKDIMGHSVTHLWGQEVFRNVVKDYLDRCFAGNEVQYEAWLEYPARGLGYHHVS